MNVGGFKFWLSALNFDALDLTSSQTRSNLINFSGNSTVNWERWEKFHTSLSDPIIYYTAIDTLQRVQ